jgi:E3 ubiquitin-protein ligase SIAH1
MILYRSSNIYANDFFFYTVVSYFQLETLHNTPLPTQHITSMSLNTISVTNDFMEELKCPICYMYIETPIFLCVNGHSICGTCRQQVFRCPECRLPFSNARNRMLERIMSAITLPCKNTTFGCTTRVSLFDQMHEKVCAHRHFPCPISTCAWDNRLSGMTGHLETRHAALVHVSHAKFITTLKNFRTFTSWENVLLYNENIFYQSSRIESDTFHTCIFHVGRENKTIGFSYNIKIRRSDGNEQVTPNHRVYHYENKMDQIIRSGGCPTFTLQHVRSCMSRNRLVIEVYINSQ